MKLAAIDLGSNSFHAVVADVSADGHFEIVDREKDVVRLAAGTGGSGRLSEPAMRRGLDVLRRYRRIAADHGVEKVIAVATSAVREAKNGEEFLERAGRETGIRPLAISGEEEARLVYLAAAHSVHVEGPTLVLDIGGGSVELALGRGPSIEQVVSRRLGSVRMAERFCRTDPLTPRDEARLAAHVAEALGPGLEDACAAGFGRLVGALALALSGHRPDGTLHHVAVPREAIREARRWLVGSRLVERRRRREIGVGRADIVVAGAVVLDEILELAGATELVLCEWALREGLLLQHLAAQPRAAAKLRDRADVRRRSAARLAERCRVDEAHARHVAAQSTALFDALEPEHRLGSDARFLLETAALLHDAGRHVSYRRHHKHSYYLIRNGGLRGLSPLEIETIALVARYHRRAAPSKRHRAFRALAKRDRRRVRVLAAILRLSEALDRGRRQRAQADRVERRGDLLRLVWRTSGDGEPARSDAARHVALLGEALGRTVELSFEAAAATASARAS